MRVKKGPTGRGARIASPPKGGHYIVRLKADTTSETQTSGAVADRLDIRARQLAHRQQQVGGRLLVLDLEVRGCP